MMIFERIYSTFKTSYKMTSSKAAYYDFIKLNKYAKITKQITFSKIINFNFS